MQLLGYFYAWQPSWMDVGLLGNFQLHQLQFWFQGDVLVLFCTGNPKVKISPL